MKKSEFDRMENLIVMNGDVEIRSDFMSWNEAANEAILRSFLPSDEEPYERFNYLLRHDGPLSNWSIKRRDEKE